MLFLDGVYVEHPDGSLGFRWVKAPTGSELARLTQTLALRIGRHLESHGLLERDAENEYPNQVTGCFMANPTAVFNAMAHGEPYPVKAFFALGNNTLLSYANLALIKQALLNQDLVVVQEHMMTPTAQLADYVLPGGS